MTRRFRAAPVVVASLLSALLVSSTASAGSPREERPVRERTAIAFWSALPQVWTAIRSIWEKEGSSLDPFGNPKPNAEPPASGTSGADTSSGN